jgi:hypothetical protein
MKKYIPITILSILAVALCLYGIHLQGEVWKHQKESHQWYLATVGLSYSTPSNTPGIPMLHSVNSPDTLKYFVEEFAANSRK